MTFEEALIFVLIVAVLMMAIWIAFLHEQLHQRNGYINRARREFDSLTNELKTCKAHLQRTMDEAVQGKLP